MYRQQALCFQFPTCAQSYTRICVWRLASVQWVEDLDLVFMLVSMMLFFARKSR